MLKTSLIFLKKASFVFSSLVVISSQVNHFYKPPLVVNAIDVVFFFRRWIFIRLESQIFKLKESFHIFGRQQWYRWFPELLTNVLCR